MSAELFRHREGSVTRLTINRPHKGNALSRELVELLIEAVQTAQGDGTRLLVFDGAAKGFCSGFDFTGFEDAGPGELTLRFIRIETLLQLVYHAPIATLALAHGKNFGAGADLVCACRHRIVSPDTSFRMPGLQFGIVLGTRRLAARVGHDAARTLLETSATFDADQALRIGFATLIAEREVWPQITNETAQVAEVLDRDAAALLYARTLSDTRDADMADIARSATTPGLIGRITSFRNSNAKG